jgi:hypothetical protein
MCGFGSRQDMGLGSDLLALTENELEFLMRWPVPSAV